MNLQISAENAQFLREQVAAGTFPTAEAAIAAAFDVLKRQTALRERLQLGIDQLERGEYIELDDEGLDRFFAELTKIGAGDPAP
jgi:hypothetical protein